ncbi:MAG: hypothetical protein K9H65_02520 [Bacteroidales bacterium]|nr:hypothetical protein [Bacteroidales bacterium]
MADNIISPDLGFHTLKERPSKAISFIRRGVVSNNFTTTTTTTTTTPW